MFGLREQLRRWSARVLAPDELVRGVLVAVERGRMALPEPIPDRGPLLPIQHCVPALVSVRHPRLELRLEGLEVQADIRQLGAGWGIP